MSDTGFLNKRGNLCARIKSAARAYRSQISVVAVSAALGLAIVLNIAMAAETTTEKAQAQLAHLKKSPLEKSTLIQ
jgi:hypothetical protein